MTEKQRFVDLQLRPICEAQRALEARIKAMKTDWEAGKSALFTNDATPYDDGRSIEGLTQMTEAEIFSAARVLIGSIATDNTGREVYNAEAISQPCVQPLQAE